MHVLNQYAALPYVLTPDGVLVCLITSRESRRWVIPKGWPKSKLTPYELAELEAREEAGLIGTISREPIGTYTYRKRLHMFAHVTCRVTVFPLLVDSNRLKWPEKKERKLAWVAPRKAAKRVAEEELSELILALPRWLEGGARSLTGAA